MDTFNSLGLKPTSKFWLAINKAWLIQGAAVKGEKPRSGQGGTSLFPERPFPAYGVFLHTRVLCSVLLVT